MKIVPVLFPSDLGRNDQGSLASTGLRGSPDVLLDLFEEQGVRFGRPRPIEVPRPESDDAPDALLAFDTLHVRAAEALADAVQAVNDGGDFPLVLGGDHTALFGHLLGHSKRHPEGFGLALLAESHLDLALPEAEPDSASPGNAEAMVLAGVLRQFPSGTALGEHLEASTLDPAFVTVAGVRGTRSAQVKRVLESNRQLDVWTMERLELDGEQAYRSVLERHLAHGPIAISIDVRGIDPHLMGAVNEPCPEGLDWSFLKRSLDQCLPHRDRILGLDICEFDPSQDDAHSVAQVRFAESIGPFLRKLSR